MGLLRKVALAIAGLFGTWLVTGSWDFIGKPLVMWISEIVLLSGTSLLQSARDSIYAEIGWRNPQNVAISSGGFLMVIMIMMYIYPAYMMFKRELYYRRKLNDDTKVIDLRGMSNRYLAFIFFMTICCVIFIFYSVVRANYIAETRNSLDRMMDVVGPSIDDKQRLELISKITLIRTQADFLKVHGELSMLAERAGMPPRKPAFVL